MKMFKDLSEKEADEFRAWAREHYKVLEPINGTWHPVIQEECVKMNKEAECPFVASDDSTCPETS